ncbi:MAG: hypothetical protein ACOC5S_04955 [Acidobacteriota bacterium]
MKKAAGTQNQKNRKWIVLCGILPFILLMSGCFCVEVKKDVKNPNKYFREAQQKINRLHQIDPDRRGPVSNVHILVFEKSERQLIRVIAPMWIIDSGMNYANTYDIDTNCDFKFQEIKKLRDLGPGLLMEVDAEDSRVLIWIE